MKFFFAIGGMDNSRKNIFEECKVEKILISYAMIQGKADLKIPNTAKEIILDSGAFSVATNVETISLKAYTLWLELYLSKYPQIVTYLNLDDLNDPQISMKNLAYMESVGLKPMPVYHYGEPTEILNELCSRYEYVGLGGMAVGTMNNDKLQTFWEWVDKTYPDNRFHILGVGSLKAFFYKQPYSLDATSWNAGATWGLIAGYKDNIPEFLRLDRKNGYKLFFTAYELYKNNIRAMLDWEKLEWLQHIPERGEQQSLF